MRVRTLILAVLLIALYSYASATIINIPADYPAIQQGIDASTDGDTVLVQPGTYVENINFNGHNIVLGSLFLTTGDTSYISQTAIDEGSVWFNSAEDSSACITGFLIRYPYGGGGSIIYCDSSSPTISYNIIRDAYTLSRGAGISCVNHASPIIAYNQIINNENYNMGGQGGGIYCGSNSSPLIMENTISGNSAEYGGGICCSGNSAAIILNNKINGNYAYWAGGGIASLNSNVIINGNEIINNNGSFLGGGIYCDYQGQVVISNNIIAGNYVADSNGGGVYSRSSDPLIINNNFYRNIADSVGGGLYCVLSNPLLINNIFRADSIGWPTPTESNEIYVESGSPVVEYCNIQGGWPGEGNIDTDPLFRDPDNGDFHLMSIACGDSADSPCIDAGDPNILDSLLDCSWGLGTTLSDMGAYGGGDSAITAILENYFATPGRFALSPNYPNPFNPTTTISFSLPEPSDISLTIYNILGQKVATLFEGIKQAGAHTFTWNADDFPSGIYFARLETGENSKNIKMLLLK